MIPWHNATVCLLPKVSLLLSAVFRVCAAGNPLLHIATFTVNYSWVFCFLNNEEDCANSAAQEQTVTWRAFC